jgi:hypothetical protein
LRERKNTKNLQHDPHSFEHITSYPLVMGIYSISANYSSHNSLSNGIIIIESFLTNINILVTKVGRKGEKPILGTSCGRGLTAEPASAPSSSSSASSSAPSVCVKRSAARAISRPELTFCFRFQFYILPSTLGIYVKYGFYTLEIRYNSTVIFISLSLPQHHYFLFVEKALQMLWHRSHD